MTVPLGQALAQAREIRRLAGDLAESMGQIVALEAIADTLNEETGNQAREIEALTAEVKRLRERCEERAAEILALQEISERPKCAYCTYGESEAVSLDALRWHVEKECGAHPIAKLIRDLADERRDKEQLIAAIQEAEPRLEAERAALTAERDGLKCTLEMWAAECGEGGPRPIKAEVEQLREEINKQTERAVAADFETLSTLVTDKNERMAQLKQERDAEHTRYVLADAGWKEMDRQCRAAEADVKALAEALEWALDMLAINDQLILEKLPEAWKSLNQDIDVAAKRRAHAALARDGVVTT